MILVTVESCHVIVGNVSSGQAVQGILLLGHVSNSRTSFIMLCNDDVQDLDSMSREMR